MIALPKKITIEVANGFSSSSHLVEHQLSWKQQNVMYCIYSKSKNVMKQHDDSW
jgi:hypothetical protein